MCQESRGRGVMRSLEADGSDNAQLTRERLESQTFHDIVEAERLADALDLVAAAVPQVQARSVPLLAERLGHAYARAMARLRAEQRQAVRKSLRQAREQDLEESA